MDLYKILQSEPSDDIKVIRTRYRNLARTYHPDNNATIEAQAKFNQISAAYETLSDPVKRAQYDSSRSTLQAGVVGQVADNTSFAEAFGSLFGLDQPDVVKRESFAKKMKKFYSSSSSDDSSSAQP